MQRHASSSTVLQGRIGRRTKRIALTHCQLGGHGLGRAILGPACCCQAAPCPIVLQPHLPAAPVAGQARWVVGEGSRATVGNAARILPGRACSPDVPWDAKASECNPALLPFLAKTTVIRERRLRSSLAFLYGSFKKTGQRLFTPPFITLTYTSSDDTPKLQHNKITVYLYAVAFLLGLQ